MIKELARIVEVEIPKGASVEEVLQELYRNGAINDRTMLFHIVSSEFFSLMRKGGRTARDIEEDLAAQHGICTRMVRYIRTQSIRGGKKGKRGNTGQKKG